MLLSDQINQVTNSLRDILKTNSQKDLPLINFNSHSILKNIFDKFNDLNINIDANTSYKDRIDIILDNLNNNLIAQENSKYMSELVDFCYELSVGFKDAYKIINTDIKETVEELIKEVDNHTTESFKRNNLTNLLEDNTDISTDHLELFNWDGIKSPSALLDIITKLKSEIKLPSDKINKINYNIVSNGIVSKKMSNFNTIKIDTLTNDQNKTLFNNPYIKFLLDKTTYKKAFINYRKEVQDIKNIKNNIKKLCIDSVNIKTLINSLDKYKDSIEPIAFQKIKSNANIVLINVLAIQFCCAYYKENLFDNTILINKFLINSPIFNKNKLKNISKEVLVSYIRGFYLNKDLPIGGVKASSIDINVIKNKLDETNVSLLAKKKLYTKKFISTAFITVMDNKFDDLYDTFNDVLINTEKDIAKDLYKKMVYKYKDILFDNIGNVEKYIYSIIIEVFFEDTIVDLIYDTFGTKLSEYIDKGNDITDDIISYLNIDTSTDIILSFITNFFINEG